MDKIKNNHFQSVVRPKNLSTQIHEQLLEVIYKGVFVVGDYLPSENRLVEIFNVSRGVIREALLMLSAKGIIEIRKGKGAKLLKPSIDTLFDPFSSLVNYRCGNNGLQYTQEVRMLIEPQIVACTAQKHNEKDIEILESYIEQMKNNRKDNKLLSFYDIEFHKKIWVSCGNPMFTIILEPIFHFLQKYHQELFYNISSNQMEGTFDEHERILKAIKEKNSVEASNAMRQHLIYSKE